MSTAETPTSEAPALQDLTHWPTPVEKATAEFERHAGRLLPGAPEVLGKMMATTLGVMAPDARAEEVEKFLASPIAQRWQNPESPATPLMPNGQAPSPLRAVLLRYPEIKPEAVDTLVREWSVSLAGKPPAKLAGEVVRRLGQPENARYLRQPIDKTFGHAFARGNATRAKPSTRTEAARSADGRFAEPPSKPDRNRSTF